MTDDIARRRRGTGYSLYELLVTLSIASIVLFVGVPSMAEQVARSRQIVEINALHHAIYYARVNSIMRRRYMSLCPSGGGQRCDASRDWSTGWILFENTDRDSPPQVDDGEAILRRHVVNPAVRLSANRKAFTVRGTRYRATNGTFVAWDVAGRVRPRALVVSYTGRPRAALETPSGEPYACRH